MMSMMEAIARSYGNKAETTLYSGTDNECTFIVQEPRKMVFRWWVIADGQVWENMRKRKNFMKHLRSHKIDPYDKIWRSV